jgi:hypothetical protein
MWVLALWLAHRDDKTARPSRVAGRAGRTGLAGTSRRWDA